MLLLTWTVACQEGDDPATLGSAPESGGDPESLGEVVAAYEKYADLNVLNAETIEDDAGCMVPRWHSQVGMFYDTNRDSPTYQAVHGVLVDDTTHDSHLDPVESGPASLLYHLDEQGLWQLTGLEWTYETGEELEITPSLFDAPMQGPMEGHSPGQEIHYHQTGYFWLTDVDLEHSLGDWVNPDLRVPAWYVEMQNVIYGSVLYYDPSVREVFGYVQRSDACVTSPAGDVGYLVTNPDLVGAMDAIVPDTLVVGAQDQLMAIQWTWPAAGGAPPTMFGLPMSGPDANGDFVFRFWMTDVPNPNGALAETHPGFSCDAPPPPEGCPSSWY